MAFSDGTIGAMYQRVVKGEAVCREPITLTRENVLPFENADAGA
jgi:hypothetical protein